MNSIGARRRVFCPRFCTNWSMLLIVSFCGSSHSSCDSSGRSAHHRFKHRSRLNKSIALQRMQQFGGLCVYENAKSRVIQRDQSRG